MSDKRPATVEEYRALLLQLCGSLTLCEHMGDVSNDVDTALRRIGIDASHVDWEDLGDWLARNHGATTLYGTSLLNESPPEVDDAR